MSIRSSRRTFLGTAATGAATFGLAGISPRLWAATDAVVETTNGKVRGMRANAVYSFLGVRYGAPTSGKNRFMPPQKPAPWAGVQDAFDYGNIAPQRNPAARAAAGPPTGLFAALRPDDPGKPESEDCLFLNVWTGGLNDRKRPVMLWLHGGGFVSGSDGASAEQGANLVRRGDVVVVGINHRLGLLGYTHLGDIAGKPFERSGNVGMLDAIAALEWVRDNIERFGGDPNRVMIFGESGGGQKVSMLLGATPAKGLFHRAVIESGPGVKMMERARASKIAGMVLAEVGLTPKQAIEIQSVPLERLMAAQFAVNAKLGPQVPGLMDGFGPVIDSEILPAHPFHPNAPAVSAEVPVIVGYNRTESTFFSDEASYSLNEEGLKTRMKTLLGDHAEQVIDVYRKASPSATASELYIDISTDYPTMGYSVDIAERRAALGRAATYMYRFDWATPLLNGKYRSPHTLEIGFVYDNITMPPRISGGGPEAAALAARVSESWIAFAETGNPNSKKSGLPEWPAYESQRRATMLFQNQSKVVNDPQGARRKVIQDILG